MSLDILVYRTKTPIPALGFDPPEDFDDFIRWKNHCFLRAWMESVFVRKGWIGEFNLQYVKLDPEDIEEIAPHLHGEKDVGFIETARQSFRDGYSLFCVAWW